MRGHKALMSSAKTGGTDNWQTPECVLDLVRQMGPIELDPCTTMDNPVGAKRFFTPEINGLDQVWDAPGIVFVNPPYSRLKEWLSKCEVSFKSGGIDKLIALVPSRTDTKAFQSVNPTLIAFLKGRLKFKGAKHCAPFPSALLFYGQYKHKFISVFESCSSIYKTAL